MKPAYGQGRPCNVAELRATISPAASQRGQAGAGRSFSPLSSAPMSKPARDHAFSDETGMPRRPRILVVEDDSALRFAMAALLRLERFDVIEADCVEDAKAKLDPRLDLVICDLRLPDGEGLSLLAPLRAIDPTIAVLIVTGFGTVDLAVRALKNGAENFLSKPVDSDELLLQVRTALLRRGPRGNADALALEAEATRPGVKSRPTSEVHLRAPLSEEATLKDVEREAILRALLAENGRVEAAARRLGVPRSTLYQKVKVYGLHVPRGRVASDERALSAAVEGQQAPGRHDSDPTES